MSLDSRPKDPRLVAAGKKAMRARWGPPRRIPVEDLTPERRDLAAALVEVLRADQAKEGGQAA